MSALLLWAVLALFSEPDCIDVLIWTAGCPPYVLRLSHCEQAAVRVCRSVRLEPYP